MEYTFSIRFNRSDAPSYQPALELAARFKHFKAASFESGVNILETDNLEVIDKYDIFNRLMEIIQDWQSARILHGQLEMKAEEWQLPQKREVMVCYKKYQDADDKDSYCDELSPECWGCRLLNGIILRHDKLPYNHNAR